MPHKLCEIKTKRKKGSENFSENNKGLGFNLLQFWQWGSSDLTSNALRGVLAEFIVANALEISSVIRKEWDAFDLKYGDIKIEIKSSAYIQSWQQSSYSKIIFGIQPTHAWSSATNKSSKKIERQSDVYVFCVLNSKDQRTINPLNLNQWNFYLLPTIKLNEQKPNQKTITLDSLLKLSPRKVGYKDIKKTIDIITSLK
jgi:hypothetical protein